MGQGHIRTRTHDFYRHGTVTLFAALDYLSGKVFAHTAPRHRHQEWLALLHKIDQEIAPEFELHIICDNYATHKHAKVTPWLKRHPRFPHPFHSHLFLWLNLVERFFGEITAKVIRPGSFRSASDHVFALSQGRALLTEYYDRVVTSYCPRYSNEAGLRPGEIYCQSGRVA